MQRVIKLRIYNPETKQMIESGATPMMLHSFFEATARLHTQLNQEYQMFTGLTDKNGVPIFEGDILKHVPDGNAPHEPVVVKWYPENCCFGLSGAMQITEIETKRMTIIGNIYENPELLNP